MPRCALLTPAGRGAIATIGVRGSDAHTIVARCFEPISKKPLAARQPGDIVVGLFSTASACREELVVGVHSCDHVEIHSHGGLAATSAILEALSREGCHVQTPAQWAADAEPDSIRAAALLALSQATTARTTGYLLDQYHGALTTAFRQIEGAQASGDDQSAVQALQTLLRRADFGLHLTQAWSIVLAGQPNSGKSSLMNAITGYQRSIVFDQPGTTRDVLLASTAIDGWPVELRDMAGLRATSETLEAAGVARAWSEIASADLVIFVSDNTAPWNGVLYEQVLAAAKQLNTPRLIIAHNKSDLAAVPADGRPPGHAVSAIRGDGVESLCQTAMHALIPEIPPRGIPIPFTSEQIKALEIMVKPDRSETP